MEKESGRKRKIQRRKEEAQGYMREKEERRNRKMGKRNKGSQDGGTDLEGNK